MELTTDIDRIRAEADRQARRIRIEIETETARKALELSRSGTDYAGYCGLLEYHMGRLLALIGDLAGEKCEPLT